MEVGRQLVATKKPVSGDRSWYNLYSDGWVEQGGVAGSGTVTLPIEMADNQYNAEYCQFYNYTGDWNNNFRVRLTNTTQLIVHPSGGFWQVSGYATASAYQGYLDKMYKKQFIAY